MGVIDCSKCIHCEVCGDRYANDGNTGECSYFLEYNPSGDLISREALKETISKVVAEERKEDAIWAAGLRYALTLIDNVPTVHDTINLYPSGEVIIQQTIPKGEWIRVEPTEEDIEQNLVPLERIECSNCHLPNRHIQYDEYHDEMTVTYHNTHYCPNCGAEMSISKGKDV